MKTTVQVQFDNIFICIMLLHEYVVSKYLFTNSLNLLHTCCVTYFKNIHKLDQHTRSLVTVVNPYRHTESDTIYETQLLLFKLQ